MNQRGLHVDVFARCRCDFFAGWLELTGRGLRGRGLRGGGLRRLRGRRLAHPGPRTLGVVGVINAQELLVGDHHQGGERYGEQYLSIHGSDFLSQP